MMKYLLFLGIGFVIAVLARHVLSPELAAEPSSPNSTFGVPAFHAPAGTQSELEHLLALARQPNRTPAQLRELQHAIDRWLLADPEACIVWLQDRKATGLIRADLLPSMCAFRLEGRMAKAMQLATVVSDPLLHYALISAAFDTAAELHPEEAFEALSVMPKAKRFKLAENLVARWTRKAPRQAWEAVSAKTDFTEVIHLSGICMSAWGAKDPDGLLAYFREQLVQPVHKPALEWGLWALTHTQPGIVFKLLSERERSARLHAIWASAFTRIENKESFDTALRYARMEPEGPRRQFALFNIGRALASSDHADQFNALTRELNPDALRNLEPARITWLFRFDPAEISAIVQDQYPNALSRSAAMSQYVQAYLNNQPQALIEMALKVQVSAENPEWLDAIAARVRTDPVTSKPGDDKWVAKLDLSTRERLGPELERRLNAADWGRVQSQFQNTPR